ncbi:uncharacterized protein [Panulirus ornatus]|uniref:uncharacterized protein isoform X3 n=1 Tax=Panulirus ornatus TaxID=150431 RepID=UPI003A877E59
MVTEGAVDFQNTSKIIKDEECKPQKVFNADETGLCWKWVPSKSYISHNHQKSAPSCTASKDPLTLLLGRNAFRDNQSISKEMPTKRKKVFTQGETLAIIMKLEEGVRPASIARSYGVNESSIHTIQKNADKIKAAITGTSPDSAKSAFHGTNQLLEKMEKMLSVWLKDLDEKQVPISSFSIREKALQLYQQLEQRTGTSSTTEPFRASKGWLERFRKQQNLQSINTKEEAASLPVLGGQNTIDGSGINNGQSVAEEVEFPLTVETPDKSPSPAEDPLQPKQIQMQHKNHFTDIMEALSCDEAFVDVTLTAEGRAIRAHKLVLSAVSPYFQQVLYDNPCRHPVIIMPYHVQFDQLTHIIEYIYKGEITIAEDQLEPLLKTAKLLQVSGLATSDSAALITESSLSTAPEMNQLPTKPNIVANHQICSSGGAVRLISTSKALVPESVSHKVSKPFYSSSVTVRSSNVSPTTPSENTSNQKKNKIANCPVVTRAVASEVVCRSAPSTFTGISDLPVTHT